MSNVTVWHVIDVVFSTQGILQELNKNSDIIKQVTASLIKFHQVAVSAIKDGMIEPETLVDSRYSHRDVGRRLLYCFFVCVKCVSFGFIIASTLQCRPF